MLPNNVHGFPKKYHVIDTYSIWSPKFAWILSSMTKVSTFLMLPVPPDLEDMVRNKIMWIFTSKDKINQNRKSKTTDKRKKEKPQKSYSHLFEEGGGYNNNTFKMLFRHFFWFLIVYAIWLPMRLSQFFLS